MFSVKFITLNQFVKHLWFHYAEIPVFHRSNYIDNGETVSEDETHIQFNATVLIDFLAASHLLYGRSLAENFPSELVKTSGRAIFDLAEVV